MEIKKFLVDLWNRLKCDERGQYAFGGLPWTGGLTGSSSIGAATAKKKKSTAYRSYVPPPKPIQRQSYIPTTNITSGGGTSGTTKSTKKSTTPTTTPITTTPITTTPSSGTGTPAIGIPEVDLNAIWEQAGHMADAEINPQLVEIDRLLQEAGYTTEESKLAINEAYPIARRSLQKSIYENMVAGEGGLAAMGTGRGGGRQELLARAGEREAAGLESIETQKLREIGALERALTNYQQQMGTQRTGLVGQRGALQSAYSEQIRGNRFNESATRANLQLGLANLAESQRQFNKSLNAYAGGTGSYIDQYANTGGATGGTTGGAYYTPTVEDINALIGSNTGGAYVSYMPPKQTPAQRYQNATKSKLATGAITGGVLGGLRWK